MNSADLARIEIVGALNAIHRLFCSELPTPRQPRFPAGQVRSAGIARLRNRSEQLTACEKLDDVAAAVARYRDWLAGILETKFTDDDGFAASLRAIRFARELHSISRLVNAFPDDAARRARNMIAKCGR